MLNVAVTVDSAEIVQVPVPVQFPPDHPANVEPEAAVAVSTADVPLPNTASQVEPQSIPAGEETTVPAPLPFFVTVRLKMPNLALAHQVPQRPFPSIVPDPTGCSAYSWMVQNVRSSSGSTVVAL